MPLKKGSSRKAISANIKSGPAAYRRVEKVEKAPVKRGRK